MAASHPRRGCRLCLAEGSETIFGMWENLPVGRKLIYSPDIYWLSTRGEANALTLVMRANEQWPLYTPTKGTLLCEILTNFNMVSTCLVASFCPVPAGVLLFA